MIPETSDHEKFVTSDEGPPSKKLRLALQMPTDMGNRKKLPLHVMKVVFDYLTREEQKALRPVCQFWSRCVATHPSHFRTLFLLHCIYCGQYSPGDEMDEVNKENSWSIMDRSMNCCGHLKDLASALGEELFIQTLPEDMQIPLALDAREDPWQGSLLHCFRNKLNKETAFSVLHLCSHLRELSFNSIEGVANDWFPSSMHPEIAKLFLTMRCHRLKLYTDRPDINIPSLESIYAAVKHQEVVWSVDWDLTGLSTAQVKDILEQFALDAHHTYKDQKIWMCSYEAENHHWTALLEMIIGLFSKALKECRQIVPRVEFIFEEDLPQWPLAPFNNMDPTREEAQTRTEENWSGVTLAVTKRTFHYKISGGPGAQAFDMEVKVECEQYDDEDERVIGMSGITFLFE